MKNNAIIITVVVAVVVAAVSFYGGMMYQKSKAPAQTAGQFANRQGGQSGRGTNGQGRFGGGRPVLGDITAVDDKSITVKMMDGSSKIVLLTGSTTISKTSDGSKSDLTTGVRVGVFGMDNSDGSTTAQNIQINPMFRGPGGSPNPSGR